MNAKSVTPWKKEQKHGSPRKNNGNHAIPLDILIIIPKYGTPVKRRPEYGSHRENSPNTVT